MKRSRVIIGSTALMMAVGGTTLAAGAAKATTFTGGKATGGINYVTDDGYWGHRSFTAQGTPTGATGQVETKLYDPTTGMNNRQFHGVVDCYRQVNATTAVFSGYITDDQGPGAAVLVEGRYFEWSVTDNGEGANAAPDRFSARAASTKPYNCKLDEVPDNQVVDGNIQVKPSS